VIEPVPAPEFIAQAGRLGGVTVATNLAGRGVDIILGGNPPNINEAEKVKEAGGLHVIGTERHEARRIDNQLRGRAGRQGDPGSSQFFVSAEDDVVRVFGGDRLKNLMDRLGVGEDDVIENSLVSKSIEQAQSKIEGHHFDSRKYVLEYDDVMNKHRTAIYKLRGEVVRFEMVHEKIVGYIENELERYRQLKEIEPDDAAIDTFLNEHSMQKYAERESEIGEEAFRNLEKIVLLRVVDELWVDHLEQMEYLRDSVRLRAYGQRDPLVEYKIEGQKMFNQLEAAIQSQVADLMFRVNIARTPQSRKIQERRQAVEPLNSELSGSTAKLMQDATSRSEHVPSGPKVGRNDPCPCGSGKKYKKCGLINAPHHRG